MHFSEFDDAASESLMIEGTAGHRLWDLLPPSGDDPTSYDRWRAGRSNDRPRVLRGHILVAIPPWKWEDAPQQTPALRRNGVRRCAGADEQGNQRSLNEEEQAQTHRHQKEDSNDNAE